MNRQTKKPIVSVVTIVFNIVKNGRKEQLEQCIKSVRQQTYQNIEHLIIDGGSKDGTVKILEKYSKKRWIKFISEPDKGKYDAMNKGVKLAKGSYITFLNSDDFYHDKNGIKISLQNLIKKHADFSYAPVTDYDEKKQKKYILTPNIKTVFFKITPNHQTIIYKKTIIIKEGLYNSKYKCLADYDLTIRLCLKNYKSVFIKNNYVTYRLGGYSLEATKNGTVYTEETNIYYKNYNKICKISKNQCEKIIGRMYYGTIKNIPFELAIKLANYKQYFDIKEYLKNLKSPESNNDKFLKSLTQKEIKLITTIRQIKYKLIPENSIRKKLFDKFSLKRIKE